LIFLSIILKINMYKCKVKLVEKYCCFSKLNHRILHYLREYSKKLRISWSLTLKFQFSLSLHLKENVFLDHTREFWMTLTTKKNKEIISLLVQAYNFGKRNLGGLYTKGSFCCCPLFKDTETSPCWQNQNQGLYG